MSLSNFSHQVSSFWGVALTEHFEIKRGQYDRLWEVLVLKTVLMLVPLFFVSRLIPANIEPIDEEGKKSEEKKKDA